MREEQIPQSEFARFGLQVLDHCRAGEWFVSPTAGCMQRGLGREHVGVHELQQAFSKFLRLLVIREVHGCSFVRDGCCLTFPLDL